MCVCLCVLAIRLCSIRWYIAIYKAVSYPFVLFICFIVYLWALLPPLSINSWLSVHAWGINVTWPFLSLFRASIFLSNILRLAAVSNVFCFSFLSSHFQSLTRSTSTTALCSSFAFAFAVAVAFANSLQPSASASTHRHTLTHLYFSSIHRIRKFSYIITITPFTTMHSSIPFTIRFCRPITNANFHPIPPHAQKIPFFMVTEMSLAHKRLHRNSRPICR